MSAPIIYDLEYLLKGWNKANGTTFAYSSYDSTIVSGVITTSTDLTGSISVGMKVKFTQITTKYAIVMAINSTTITLHFGTDYTLTTDAISDFYYSSFKVPFGFPMNPNKWDIIVKDTVGLAQSNPTAGTYYNIGSFKINLGPGIWDLGYDLIAEGAIASGTQAQCQVTLSTSSTSTSDVDFNALARIIGATGALTITEKQSKSKVVEVSTKTPFYLLAVTGVAGQSSIGFKSATGTTILKAKCVYL